MRGDSLVAQALLEVLMSLFLIIAVKVVNILNRDFLAVGYNLNFESFTFAKGFHLVL